MSVAPTRESVLRALDNAQKPLKIREIAHALHYHTNTPWAIVDLVEVLERDGFVVWEKKRPCRVRRLIQEAKT